MTLAEQRSAYARRLDEAVERIQTVRAEVACMRRVSLFGSYARGAARPLHGPRPLRRLGHRSAAPGAPAVPVLATQSSRRPGYRLLHARRARGRSRLAIESAPPSGGGGPL